MAERDRREPARTDTDQTHQTDVGKKDIEVDPGKHQVTPLDRLAEDLGKQFRQDIG